jgi:ATP-binding cassette subfamily B protein
VTSSTDTGKAAPPAWRAAHDLGLAPGERVLAWFEPDLDQRLNYSASLLALTQRRLISVPAEDGRPGTRKRAIDERESWPIDAATTLSRKEQGGVGILELLGPHGRLTYWRYTAARSAASRRFEHAFRMSQAAGLSPADGAAREPARGICPSCGALITSDDGECPACKPASAPPAVSSLFRLWRFARPHWRVILVGFLLTVSGTAASLIPPYLTIPLLDKVLIPYSQGKDVDFVPQVTWYLSALGIAAVLAWLLEWARKYVLAWVSERIAADLRTRTYGHLQSLSLEFFGGKRTGDLMSRIGSDTDRINNFLCLNLIDFASDVLMFVMTAAVLVSIDPILAVATLVPLPPIIYLVHMVRAKLWRGFRRSGNVWGQMTSVLADTIPGIRVVKAFAQEKREIERFVQANDRVLDANDRVNVVWSFFGPLVRLMTDFGLLVVWVFGAWQIFGRDITVGQLTAFVAYIARFYTKVESMIQMVSASQRAAAASHRLFEILDRQPTVAEPVKPVALDRVRGRIELLDVKFRYGSYDVLHGVNLVIRPGEMIGLVGHSGAGKSTVVNLICRFYDVSEGAVLVDGVDIRSFRIADYRRNIGIVLQEPFLFYGTVAENIAYGRPAATHQEIVAAARAARAHEFILRLPDGYDSLVGERGQTLSGGERQRISIARALLIDPRILILDEATSSVDTETEREIQAALDHLVQGRTTVAIAHRLSTLRRADRLVVLERGRIVEEGNHDELLASQGTYYRLHQAQRELTREHTPGSPEEDIWSAASPQGERV